MRTFDRQDDSEGPYGESADSTSYLEWDDEEDFVTVRSGGFRILRAVLAVVVLVAIGWVLYTGVRSWFSAQLDPAGEPGETVTLVIPSGATTGNIAQQLEAEGVIPNSTFFRYYTDWRGVGNFQAGEYEMQLNSSADEAISVLQAGPIPPVFTRFGMREGLWVDEILPLIAEQVPTVTVEELRAVLDSGQLQARYRPEGNTSWEGLLFPAFYEVDEDATAVEVLSRMLNEFARVAGELGYGAAETRVNRTAYEVIIIASMIEAEAKTEADRPKIARVIYNRLAEGMSLDIDAVCLYGLQNRDPGQLVTSYLQSEAATTGPYPCRRNSNLPATPIAAPGRASLEAALNPSEGPEAEGWRFYVLCDAEGNHCFNNTLEEHNRQVAISREAGLF